MSGFILGFDHEKPGAGKRIQEFIEETSIPQAHLSLLQALPNTAMWTRLQQEGRLIDNFGKYFTSQKSLMNFVPTRPMPEIVKEFIEAFWHLYEPLPYLKRTFRHFQKMSGRQPKYNRNLTQLEWRFFMAICWRQGILSSTRILFWWQFIVMAFSKPHLLYEYLIVLGIGEHFFNFRHEVKAELEAELALLHQQIGDDQAGSLQLEAVS